MKKYILKYYKINGVTELQEGFTTFNEAFAAIEDNTDIANVKFVLIFEVSGHDQVLSAARFYDVWKLTTDKDRDTK